MKTNPFRSLVGAVVVCLVFSLGLSLFARPAKTSDLLIQAYTALEQADHDYKGRRVEAMKQIKEAGRLMGVTIGGEGKGHEKQGVSDEQMRVAKGLLEQASAGMGKKALKHVNKAIEHISVGLNIK